MALGKNMVDIERIRTLMVIDQIVINEKCK